MDLTSEIFTTILSPLAAFVPPDDAISPSAFPTDADANTHTDTNSNTNNNNNTPYSTDAFLTPWQTSPTNPQSRLDSLAPIRLPADAPPSSFPWRLDGVDPTGRRFFVVPRFALGRPPLRIDAYLTPAEAFPRALRDAVGPEEAICRRRWGGSSPSLPSPVTARGVKKEEEQQREKEEIGGAGELQLDVGTYLLRVLWRWGRTCLFGQAGEEGGLEGAWWRLPFGSFISVDVRPGPGREEVVLVPEYGAEQRMVELEALRRMWARSVPPEAWNRVEAVDWERLGFVRQLHEVISLVQVDGRPLVFKSVLREQQHMYNELKMLLALGDHPNVVSRPVGVVTKRARFGNRSGVCGFLLEWFPLGSLRERMLRDDYERITPVAQRFRWARQITQALVHVNGHREAGFYPDLKPDNIVLRQDTETGMLDAVLIDLEQRGGWFSWSPPEVAYLEYLEVLAGDPGVADADLKAQVTEQLREYYGDPDWLPGAPVRYRDTDGGFSAPWLALLRERQRGSERKDALEKAQVFMLGKLLWCIFEGQPFVRCGIDHEVLRDADPEYEASRSGRARAFPEFKKTPESLRRLIRACTAGARQWSTDGHQRTGQSGVVLRRGKLYPTASGGVDSDTATAKETLEAARRYWRDEVNEAQIFVHGPLRTLISPGSGASENVQVPCSEARSGLLGQAASRPTFRAVLEELELIEKSTCPRTNEGHA